MKKQLNKENISEILNNQCGVYKITNIINNHCYIGVSVDIKRRLYEHLRQKYKATIYDAFNKYGINSFVFEIIELCNKDQLLQKEKYWIEFYDSYNNGYNMTPGGDYGYNNRHCRQIAQYDLDGNYISKYDSILEAERQLNLKPKSSSIGRVCQGIAYMSNGFQWRYIIDENYILNIGKCPEKAICKSKQIAQCDIETHEIIRIFNSIHEASRITGFNRANISQVCNGNKSSSNGYYWMNIEKEKNNLNNKEIKNMMKPVSEKALQVLNFLKGNPDGNYTSADIGQALGYEKKTIDGVVTAGLIRNKNLVERVEAEIELEDGSHKGIKLIKLTPAGMEYNHDDVIAAYEASVAAEKAAKAAE